MWKYTPILDDDKDAGTVMAQLLNDNDEVVFTYSERVTLTDDAEIQAFIRRAKAKSDFKDERTAKVAEYITKLADADVTVDALIVTEKAEAAQALEDAKNAPVGEPVMTLK